MTIVTGMVLICSFYAYAPEFNRSGKVEIKNVETTTLFQEGDNMLVSYRFQENESIGFLNDQAINKYVMENIEDLKSRCTEKKKKVSPEVSDSDESKYEVLGDISLCKKYPDMKQCKGR